MPLWPTPSPGKKGLAAGFAAGLIASLSGSGFLGAAIGGHPWAYFAGALVGTLVIAIGANLLVNFNDDESTRTADEKHSTKEIGIKFD